MLTLECDVVDALPLSLFSLFLSSSLTPLSLFLPSSSLHSLPSLSFSLPLLFAHSPLSLSPFLFSSLTPLSLSLSLLFTHSPLSLFLSSSLTPLSLFLPSSSLHSLPSLSSLLSFRLSSVCVVCCRNMYRVGREGDWGDRLPYNQVDTDNNLNTHYPQTNTDPLQTLS